MKERILWGIIALLIVVVAFLIFFENETSTDIARIEKKVITEHKFVDELIKKHGTQLLFELIEREAIYYEAKRLAVEVSEREIDKEIEKYKHNLADGDKDLAEVLANEYMISLEQLREDIQYNLLLEKLATLDARVSDAEIEKYYLEHQELFHENEKFKVRRILLNDKAEAEQANRELQQGANFAALASELSIDRISAANGGDIGYVQEDSLYIDQELVSVASKLEVGQYSAPFETYEGWNIIKLEERIDGITYELTEVKPQIYRELALKQVKPLNEYLQDLIKKLDIEIYEDNIKQVLTFEKN